MDKSSPFILDTIHWSQTDDFVFPQGFLNFKNEVLMSGQGYSFYLIYKIE